MEISRCKYCGNEGMLTEDNLGRWYVECTNIDCMCTSPNHKTEKEAILIWNSMMQPSVTIPTDYRDRVDRMVAAMLNGHWSGETNIRWDDNQAVKKAMCQIDAIDAAIKERENKI